MNVVAKRGQLRLQSYVLNEGNIRCAERLRGRLNLDGYQLLRVPATGDTQQRIATTIRAAMLNHFRFIVTPGTERST